MKISKTLKLRLVSESDIPFENHFIHQPTIADILKYGEESEEVFDNLIIPFSMNKDILPEDTEEQMIYKDRLKNFDLLLFSDSEGYMFKDDKGNSMLDNLVEALKLFFQTSNVFYSEREQVILVDYDLRVHRENFDKLSDIILLICQRKRIEKKEENKSDQEPILNDRAKRAMDRLYKMREKKAREEAEKHCLANIINVLKTNTLIKKEDILNSSIWSIINVYKSSLTKESYDQTMSVVSTGMVDTSSMDLTHWTEKISL